MSDKVIGGASRLDEAKLSESLVHEWRIFQQAQRVKKEQQRETQIHGMIDAITHFFQLKKEDRATVQVLEDDDGEIYAKYDDVRLFPSRAGFYLVDQCPYCLKMTAGNEHVGSRMDLGRMIAAKKESGHFLPSRDHLEVCGELPQETSVEEILGEENDDLGIIGALMSLKEELKKAGVIDG